MRYRKLYTLLVCLFLANIEGISQQTELQVDVLSKYIWRDVINDFGVIQPMLDYRFPAVANHSRSFSLNTNLWFSIQSGKDTGSDPIESAITIYGSWQTKDSLSIHTGIVHYAGYDPNLSFFELPIHNWLEVYFGLSEIPLPLNPALEIYYNEVTGLYSTIYLDYDLRVSSVAVHSSAQTEIRNFSKQSITDYRNGWRHLSISIGIPIKLSNLSFEPYYTYSFFPSLNDSRFYVGLNISLP